MTERNIPVGACTLEDAELTTRIDEWRELAAHVTASTPTGDGIRLVFPVDASTAARAAELAALEQGCCGGLLRFGLDIGPRSMALTVWGSAASALIEALELQPASPATTSR